MRNNYKPGISWKKMEEDQAQRFLNPSYPSNTDFEEEKKKPKKTKKTKMKTKKRSR